MTSTAGRSEFALTPLQRAWPKPERLLLHLYVLLSALFIWLAQYPPLGDLPQHAAQVALALDLLHGHSRWADIVTFNFFTPYLAGYALLALAAQFMSIASAAKLTLSLAVVGFFWAGSALRRRFQAPALLDWLLLPAFFGFAFKWGFLTFLLAAPVGLFFILKSLDFSENPDPKNMAQLLALGLVLFFSHGLVFVACAGIGFCYALLAMREGKMIGRPDWNKIGLLLAPYILLGLLTLSYVHFAMGAAQAQYAQAKALDWRWSLRRPVQFFRFQWDVGLGARNQSGYLLDCLAFALFYMAPFLLGMPLKPGLRRFIPFGVVALIGLAGPHTAMKTAFIYERFALFLLPFYVLLFSPAERVPPEKSRLRLFTLAAIPAICFCATAWRGWQFHEFDQESRDFKRILDAIPPRQRVLSMMLDRRSPAAANPYAYLHFPCWYQAEKGGFVDSNFAQMLPQIVRFKPGQAWVQLPFEWKPYRFEWATHRGEHYDYFVLRSERHLFPRFAGQPCDVALVTSAGPWALYRKLPWTCAGANHALGREAPAAP